MATVAEDGLSLTLRIAEKTADLTPVFTAADAAFVSAASAEQHDVDLASLLDDVVARLRRYVVFHSDAQAHAIALWALHTYTVAICETTPYLAILSPERRCGKTRLLDVLEFLVARPWRVIAPSEAVLFRQIAAVKPTLLLDEVDAIYSPRNAQAFEGIRALLNAGNRVGTQVPRCVGDGANLKVQNFDVYGAKALAGIGQLPDTVADRSILIRLARRAPGEAIARFRQRDAKADFADLRADIAAWAETITDLGEDRPELPDELDDRAQDSWEPLLAIADRAGGAWPVRARQAALELSRGRDDDNTSLGIKLLADLRTIFADELAVPTSEIIARLKRLDESPWADLHGVPITSRRLASLLKPYDVHPRDVRIGSAVPKGYRREDLFEPWKRYLLPLPVAEALHALHPLQDTTTDSKVPARGDIDDPASGENVADSPVLHPLQTPADPLHATDVLQENMPICRDVADVAHVADEGRETEPANEFPVLKERTQTSTH